MNTILETTEAVADPQAPASLGRRSLLTGFGGAVAGSVALLALAGKAGQAQTTALTDIDILNFALNQEYLEAEFYLRGVFGRGLNDADTTGAGTAGAVTGGRQVTFTNEATRQFLQEIALDEETHVRFVRQRIQSLGGTPIARPAIDYTNGFNAAAQAANIVPAGGTFDPFASELFFLHGGFTFSDVGVTAYKGSAALIRSKAVLGEAARILAVEAYHDGILRTLLYEQQGAPTVNGLNVAQTVQAISDLRDAADGAVGIADKDQGILLNGQANIVPADANSIAFGRTPGEVLRIVYLKSTPGAATSGGFFPAGVNGTVRTSNAA